MTSFGAGSRPSGGETLPGFVDWLLNRPASDLWATMSPDRMYIEHSREFLGLLIAGASLVTARRLSLRDLR